LNGTTFVFHSNVISEAVITGGNKGEYFFIPCIKLEPSESYLPFTVRRRQFSAIWAFAMTISKSSRQSFGCVGVCFLDMANLLMIRLYAEGLKKMLRFAITTFTIKEFCQLIVHLHTV
jgi:hypothetical protein